MSSPYGLCQREASQLLVIDIQERLAAAMPDKVRQQVTRNSGILSQAAGLLGIPTRVTRQYPKGLGDLVEELQPALEGASCHDKTSFSCCRAEGIDQTLSLEHGHQVVIAGMESHVCVMQTAIELRDKGFEVFVVEDAVCSRSKPNHRNALQRLAQAGIVITNSESVVLEWLRDAKHQHFKTISGLIK
jgi:nicotinamidase-related amidase